MLARFISADTRIPGQDDTTGPANPQHRNRSSYVNNNPINRTDPSGHDWEHFAPFALGVAQGALATINSVVETSTPDGAANAGVNLGMAIGRDPAGFVQGVKDQVTTVIRGGANLVNDPAGAAATLGEHSGELGQVMGQALATAALARACKALVSTTADSATVASTPPDLENLDKHALSSTAKRGWTKEQITEAFDNGKAHPAIDKTAGNTAATREVYPTTGKSVVINDGTGRVIHVGGEGFKYE